MALGALAVLMISLFIVSFSFRAARSTGEIYIKTLPERNEFALVLAPSAPDMLD
jgi:hypothetical protein